jgi:hypothetical protein
MHNNMDMTKKLEAEISSEVSENCYQSTRHNISGGPREHYHCDVTVKSLTPLFHNQQVQGWCIHFKTDSSLLFPAWPPSPRPRQCMSTSLPHIHLVSSIVLASSEQLFTGNPISCLYIISTIGSVFNYNKTNSVAFSPQENYTD